jgi:hypothetical protein
MLCKFCIADDSEVEGSNSQSSLVFYGDEGYRQGEIPPWSKSKVVAGSPKKPKVLVLVGWQIGKQEIK